MDNILIIGGSTGIGKELVELLAAEGKNVFATYNETEITNNQQNISYHKLNIADDDFELNFLPESLNAVIYCVGAINLKSFVRTKTTDFLQDFNLQVLGAIKVIQKALPKLKQSKNASIVLFSTVAAQLGFNFHSIVATSKGAIEGLTKALAAEFAPKIRVNCIAPSITNTPLAAKLLSTPEKIEANAQRHPLKKVGNAKEIAALAQFLISKNANWMSGQILKIDGGISTIKI